MASNAPEFTLFADDGTQAQELMRQIEEAGHRVHLVMCGAEDSTPYVQTPYATIVGYSNIQRYLVPRPA